MSEIGLAEGTPLGIGWDGPVVDCDVHAVLGGVEDLFRYLDDRWIEFVRVTGFSVPPASMTVYPPNGPLTAREEWIPDSGGIPGGDVQLLRQHVLDPLGADFAIVNNYWGVESVRHPDFGPALAAAVNDWLVDRWLDQEPRLRASIVVPSHEPAAAAREIERVGGHPGFVQVLLPLHSMHLYGRRLWYPMFEAIERHGLVAGLHYGGYADGPPTPVGWPSWYLEEHAASTHMCLAQLTSMLGEGTFEKFPNLKIAVLEGGFTWVPPMLWRLDKEWKGLRRDVPWIKEFPSRLFRERVKFSVRPLDAGPPEFLPQVIEELGSEEVLMFASDYPHAHEDDTPLLLDSMPESMRPKVMSENARQLYGLG